MLCRMRVFVGRALSLPALCLVLLLPGHSVFAQTLEVALTASSQTLDEEEPVFSGAAGDVLSFVATISGVEVGDVLRITPSADLSGVYGAERTAQEGVTAAAGGWEVTETTVTLTFTGRLVAGLRTVSLEVVRTGGTGGSATARLRISVPDAQYGYDQTATMPLRVSAGRAVSLQLPRPAGAVAPLQYAVVPGFGLLPDGLTLSGTGRLAGRVDRTFARPLPYPVRVRATDSRGLQTEQDAHVHVSDASFRFDADAAPGRLVALTGGTVELAVPPLQGAEGDVTCTLDTDLGLTVSADCLRVTGLVPEDQGLGRYLVSVIATDTRGVTARWGTAEDPVVIEVVFSRLGFATVPAPVELLLGEPASVIFPPLADLVDDDIPADAFVRYSVTPEPVRPNGMAFDGGSRAYAGTPTELLPADFVLLYRGEIVQAGSDDPVDPSPPMVLSVAQREVRVTVGVQLAFPAAVPAVLFGQPYSLILPRVTAPGTAGFGLTYRLSGADPVAAARFATTGLSFDAETASLMGVVDPGAVTPTPIPMRYEVLTDQGVVVATHDFSLMIERPVLTFAANDYYDGTSGSILLGMARVGDQLDPVTLPEAAGGSGEYEYRLESVVPGLTFVATDRGLGGRIGQAGALMMTYVAEDVGDRGFEPAMLVVRIEALANLNNVAKEWGARFGRSVASAAVDTLSRRFADTGELRSVAERRAGPHQDLDSGIVIWTELTHAEVTGGSVGVDAAATTGLVGVDSTWDAEIGEMQAGVALSHSQGSGDYADAASEQRGELDAGLTAIYPYVRWSPSPGTGAWAFLGYGTGDVEVTDESGPDTLLDEDPVKQTHDISLAMLAVGGRTVTGLKPLGLTSSVVGDIYYGSTSVARAGSTGFGRLRAGWEIAGDQPLVTGAGLVPEASVAARYDFGDLDTGYGLEVAAGASYIDYQSGYRIGLRGHGVVYHSGEDVGDWGVSLNARFAPGRNGRGLAFSAGQTLGAPQVDQLWTAGPGGPQEGAEAATSTVELAYGFEVGSGYRTGVLTPYASTQTRAGSDVLRSGLRFGHDRAQLKLDAYAERDKGAADTEVGVTGALAF